MLTDNDNIIDRIPNGKILLDGIVGDTKGHSVPFCISKVHDKIVGFIVLLDNHPFKGCTSQQLFTMFKPLTGVTQNGINSIERPYYMGKMVLEFAVPKITDQLNLFPPQESIGFTQLSEVITSFCIYVIKSYNDKRQGEFDW